MRFQALLPRVAPLAALLALLAACGGGGDDGGSTGTPANPAPSQGTAARDFRLPDVNPASASYNTSVGPTLRLGKVSAWYFAHAT